MKDRQNDFGSTKETICIRDSMCLQCLEYIYQGGKLTVLAFDV